MKVIKIEVIKIEVLKIEVIKIEVYLNSFLTEFKLFLRVGGWVGGWMGAG